MPPVIDNAAIPSGLLIIRQRGCSFTSHTQAQGSLDLFGAPTSTQAKAKSGRLCGSAAASYRREGGRTVARLLYRRARSQSPNRYPRARGPPLKATSFSSASSALAIQRLLELELDEDKALPDGGGHNHSLDSLSDGVPAIPWDASPSPKPPSSPILYCSHHGNDAASMGEQGVYEGLLIGEKQQLQPYQPDLAQIQFDLAACRKQLKLLREQVQASEQLPCSLGSPLRRVRGEGGDDFESPPPL